MADFSTVLALRDACASGFLADLFVFARLTLRFDNETGAKFRFGSDLATVVGLFGVLRRAATGATGLRGFDAVASRFDDDVDVVFEVVICRFVVFWETTTDFGLTTGSREAGAFAECGLSTKAKTESR